MEPQSTAQKYGRDFLASFVVFLVALPLCMGIAIASGVPVGAGLITGIIGGIVVGSIAGSPLQVSGPAAGLTVIIVGIVQDPELGLPMLGLIVLGGGILQITAGALRLGQWFRAISPTVIAGMLAGIGVIIFSSQFHVMVDDTPRAGALENFISIPNAIYKGITPTEETYHHHAAWIGLLTIVSLVCWNTFRPKKLKVVPGPLVGVLVGAGVSQIFGYEQILYVELPTSLVEAINWPNLDDLSFLQSSKYWGKVVAVAIVASAETLLCATAVDQLHTGVRTKYDRELVAQGIGNTICGILGALPMTGVIVRSSANVDAGGTTRASAILHGIWLLALVALAPFVLELIPKASLAAILVYTGYRLMNWQAVKKLNAFGKSEVAIYFATVLTIVAADLLIGVFVGFALSVLKLHYTFSFLEVRVDEPNKEGYEVIHIDGAATFLRLPALAQQLEALPKDHNYIVNFNEVDYIDHACLELIAGWEKQVIAKGGKIDLEWDDLLHRYNFKERRAGTKTPSQRISKSVLSGGDH